MTALRARRWPHSAAAALRGRRRACRCCPAIHAYRPSRAATVGGPAAATGRFAGPDRPRASRSPSSDPQVVTIEDGVALPVGNGQTTITATAGGRRRRREVTVAEMDQPVRLELSQSCRAGAREDRLQLGRLPRRARRQERLSSFRCADSIPWPTIPPITRQARAGASCWNDPGRSLLLTKPTGAIPHKGGLRFARRFAGVSGACRVDRRRRAGRRKADDPRLARLEILARQRRLKPGDEATVDRARLISTTATSKTSPAGRSTRRPTNRWPRSTPPGW